MEKIKVVKLTKIFGEHPEPALERLSQGMSKDDGRDGTQW